MINELNELTLQASECVKHMKKYAKAYAEAERDYRVKKAQVILRLRDEGFPATLIPDMAKGECANEIFQEVFMKGMWEAAKENVNVTKLEIRLLAEQIQREWGECKGEI